VIKGFSQLSSLIVIVTMGNSPSLEDELVNLRITSKQMSRSAVKCEKNEKQGENSSFGKFSIIYVICCVLGDPPAPLCSYGPL